ncbi:MAG: NAD(P)H-hydrate epimerase [Candidatus Brocadiae bacterium]|nr:NAD(P)H-hydrate epimerase [Candidatus Brocadiia bacterium]
MLIYSHATREEIRELDRLSVEEYQMPSILLMENAGREAARILAARKPAGPVNILCGPGNNGGDGFVIARHLYNQGFQIKVFYAGELKKIPALSDPGINLGILNKMDLTPIELLETKNLSDLLYSNQPEIFVDALLGTGLSGSVRQPIRAIIQEINQHSKDTVAIDIPSGLDANTGEILGIAIKAVQTITFALPKKGFLLGKGPEVTGEVIVVEISIPRNLLEKKCLLKQVP